MNNSKIEQQIIIITGASGLIGKRLVKKLIKNGHYKVRILTRDRSKLHECVDPQCEIFEWDAAKNFIEDGALQSADIVINLAGENIAEKRWSANQKQKISDSRIVGTQFLIREIEKLKFPPKKLISASAIGIYGNKGEETVDTTSSLGNSFLAQVCRKWENSAMNNKIEKMNSIIIRIGIVLGNDGGAFAQMIRPFSLGLGGQLGNGKQYMSWIHIDDLVGQIMFLITNDKASGIYNGVSPRPVTNFIFSKILGRELNRPTLFKIPKFALKMVLGEFAEVLLESQKIIPTRFIEQGYDYKFRSIKSAFRDLIKRN